MLMRRFGRPGLLGTVARTAVIAGTATATRNALDRRQQRNAEQEAEAEAFEQQAAAPAAAAPAGLGDQLTRLATLHESGALTDEEFAAAKLRLLG
ncbi:MULTISPECIES: SHOCT domain-containing protein [unclassified Nocardioides]|uniref:SHOCT domain-containing protein n=1 Tax=unclassified Nocardioides TaxID=2615069 RepID=UPI003014B871